MRHALFLVSLVAVAACGTKATETADTSLPIYTGAPTGLPLSGPLTGAPTGTPPESIAIAGTWTDTWGTEHIIGDTSWSMGFPGYAPALFSLTQYSNADQHAVGQNDPANAFYPDLWSRFDWHVDAVSGDTWFCQTAFDRPSEAEAVAVVEANAADLAYGCGGFSWTQLLP